MVTWLYSSQSQIKVIAKYQGLEPFILWYLVLLLLIYGFIQNLSIRI